MGLWIIEKCTTSERSREWSTRYSSRNDTAVATLLSLGYIVGLPTRKFGTTDVDSNYLVKAASVGLQIVMIATTQGWYWKWMARNTLGNDSGIAALLGMRNVEHLSTWQSRTTNLEGYYLTEATSVGLWII